RNNRNHINGVETRPRPSSLLLIQSQIKRSYSANKHSDSLKAKDAEPLTVRLHRQCFGEKISSSRHLNGWTVSLRNSIDPHPMQQRCPGESRRSIYDPTKSHSIQYRGLRISVLVVNSLYILCGTTAFLLTLFIFNNVFLPLSFTVHESLLTPMIWILIASASFLIVLDGLFGFLSVMVINYKWVVALNIILSVFVLGMTCAISSLSVTESRELSSSGFERLDSDYFKCCGFREPLDRPGSSFCKSFGTDGGEIFRNAPVSGLDSDELDTFTTTGVPKHEKYLFELPLLGIALSEAVVKKRDDLVGGSQTWVGCQNSLNAYSKQIFEALYVSGFVMLVICCVRAALFVYFAIMVGY
ncbi:hypothetical protein BDR26DRAFT_888114, partial [Obelidium mucronatum]